LDVPRVDESKLLAALTDGLCAGALLRRRLHRPGDDVAVVARSRHQRVGDL